MLSLYKKTELQEQMRRIKNQYRLLPKDIQWMCRADKIAVQGTKPTLWDSWQKHQRRTTCAILVQSWMRGHLVRMWWKKATPYKLSRCVNDADFFTLTPLTDYSVKMLYCPTTTATYGFQVGSLMRMIQKRELMNPYTREAMSEKDIEQVYRLVRLLFSEVVAEYPEEMSIAVYSPKQSNRHIQYINRIYMEPSHSWVQRPNLLNLVVHSNGLFNETQSRMIEKLAYLEMLPVHRRVIEMFIDIDLLGNYTNMNWFLHLNSFQLRRFYSNLRNNWTQLPLDVRHMICIVGNPYEFIYVNFYEIPEEELRMACVMVMEMMIYCGNTVEFQKLGVYQVLIALCSVSAEARQSLHHFV